jgi:predicted dehydrogenase
MINVGVIGFGFMGRMHFSCYKNMKNVRVVALCDIEPKKFEQKSGGAGNIKGAEKPLDFSGIELFQDFETMVKTVELDAVSITLPTYLHCEYTLKALKAGLNVLCEKPMAMDGKECEKMIDAAKKSKRILQVGHCIRFWPEYAKAKEIIESHKYGKVLAATFQRLSLTPTWSWKNWLLDGRKSGGANLDLHIHDSDFVQYLFGMPKSVFSRGAKGPSKAFDHIVTDYLYPDGKIVVAEGGWLMKPGFGFQMSFNIVLENATISYDCTRSPAFKLADAKGNVVLPKVAKGDGYSCELEHFVKAVSGKSVPRIITPRDSQNSVKLVLAEQKSAQTRREVAVR